MKLNQVKIGTWNRKEKWPLLVGFTAKAMRLTQGEKEKLTNSPAAELVAATAFLSECQDPDRVAVAHLTTFMAAVRCPELFGHRKGETLSDRLLTGNYFPGGDPETVRACMLILEMISLNDHKRDFKDDLINGKFNPLAHNLNYDEAREKIEKEFKTLSPAKRSSFQNALDELVTNAGMWF